MNENILKYKVQKKKLNSNNAKDVAFQDMVILSNEVKFFEVSESVRVTNENILKYRGADWQHFQQKRRLSYKYSWIMGSTPAHHQQKKQTKLYGKDSISFSKNLKLWQINWPAGQQDYTYSGSWCIFLTKTSKCMVQHEILNLDP